MKILLPTKQKQSGSQLINKKAILCMIFSEY